MGSDTEKELHQRFVAVCEQHTQAEVARRTGIPAHYIYRYVKGTRIPAELCSRLVEGLNINPAWLLAGQGAMSLSEVSDQVSSMAKDMTELVKAMAAVSRMKLGSLTGKERNRIFRELSETLAAYEALRNDLRRKTRPYLEELLQDMARALEQHKLERAGELKTAIEQLVPLCDNEKLELDQLGLFANYHFKQLDFARALDYRRESFSRMFRNKARLTPEDARECTAFGRVLIQNGHLVEARGLLKGFRAMVESYSQGWREMHPLCMLFGWSELELGNMLEGRSLIEQSFAHMDDEHRNLTAGIVLRAALYAGSMKLEQAIAANMSGIGIAPVILQHACWEENEEALEAAYARYVGKAQSGITPEWFIAVRARYLLTAVQTGKRKLVDEFLRDAQDTLETPHEKGMKEFVVLVTATQIAHICGAHDSARDLLRRSEAKRLELDGNLCPMLLVRASHYRNALALLIDVDKHTGNDAALIVDADSFFSQHFDAGYGCFRSVSGEFAAS